MKLFSEDHAREPDGCQCKLTGKIRCPEIVKISDKGCRQAAYHSVKCASGAAVFNKKERHGCLPAVPFLISSN